MVAKGLVATNKIGWADELLPHLRYLRPQRLQVLVYDYWMDRQIADLLQVQEALPEIEFLARVYAANIITFDAGDWARGSRRRVNLLLQAGVRVIGAICGNEPNIETPDDRAQLRSDWGYQAQWYWDFAAAWHDYGGRFVELHLPALSPAVPGWTDGLDAYRDAGLGDAYHVIDAHCYPGTEMAYYAVIDRFPVQPVAITEYNGIDPENYLASLPGHVSEAYWFIARWEDPEPGARNVDLIGSEYYESFARAGRNGGTMEYDRDVLWAEHEARIAGLPMFDKVRLGHPELGDPLGPEFDRGQYRLREYLGGFIWAPIGAWDRTAVATRREDLPLA